MLNRTHSEVSILVRYCAIGPPVGTLTLLIVLLSLELEMMGEQRLGYLQGVPGMLLVAIIVGYLIGIIPAALTGLVVSRLARGRGRQPTLWVWGGVLGSLFSTLPYAIVPDLQIEAAGLYAYPVLSIIGFLAGAVPAMGLHPPSKNRPSVRHTD